jgi:hypothetical protein
VRVLRAVRYIRIRIRIYISRAKIIVIAFAFAKPLLVVSLTPPPRPLSLTLDSLVPKYLFHFPLCFSAGFRIVCICICLSITVARMLVNSFLNFLASLHSLTALA